MERKYAKGIAVLLIVFAVGLVGFYAFSAMYGDGLEKTMDDNGVSEDDPVWEAPFDYGSDYSATLVMGILGFLIVLAVTMGYLMMVRKKKGGDRNDKKI